MTAEPYSFDPETEDPRAFRAALGKFITGVTIITCESGTGPIGITANSFASLSLDPPLVLWAPAKSSQRYPFYMAAEHFAIHVMGAEQSEISNGFARDGNVFDVLDWETSEHGVPLIGGCLSRFECTRIAQHDGGDHSIIIGRVTRVMTRPGKPLAFFAGKYGAIEKPS
ncbi:flavin reductase family protein [Primorskyibacter flagellatus]|uniref:flavin reductase family protein n=1 Tax=Primorskyibacter flagellatus TaxID=1387277 RepID=UPI003A901253